MRKVEMSCHLQKWTTRPGPGSGRWWRVSIAAVPAGSRLECVAPDVSEDPMRHEDRTLAEMEADEESRLV